jgi:hypothetical protein
MEWLDSQGIKYEEHSAAEDETIRSVPVTRIDQKDGSVVEVIGFDRPAIKEALKTISE